MMDGASARGGMVVVYGGAPTSAWNTGIASINHNQVIWMANPAFWGFKTANPAGRNSEIIRQNLRRNGEKTGKDTELVVSQFVYAIGTDPRLALSFLGPYTYASLSPIYDVHACFSGRAFNAALGLSSEDGDVVVVGPAAYKGLSAKGSSLLWENMATAFLRRPSRTPESR